MNYPVLGARTGQTGSLYLFGKNIGVLVDNGLQTLHQSFLPVYSDGSEGPNTGYAYNIPALQVKGISDHLSVYLVEYW